MTVIKIKVETLIRIQLNPVLISASRDNAS